MEYPRQSRFLVITTIVLIIFNISLLALIWQHHSLGTLGHPGKKSFHDGTDFLKSKLNLSPEQVKLFSQLRQDHFKAFHSIMDENRKLHDEFFQSFHTSDTNVTRITDRIAMLSVKKEMALYQHFLDLKAACNDKQKTELVNIFQEFMHRQRPKDPKGGHRPPPR
jgi:hypothetical protein